MAPHTTPSAETTPTRTATQRAHSRSRCGQRPCAPVDRDLLSFNVRLAKMRQALLDTNRIERKTFRDHARIENAAAAYARELAALLDERGLTQITHEGFRG